MNHKTWTDQNFSHIATNALSHIAVIDDRDELLKMHLPADYGDIRIATDLQVEDMDSGLNQSPAKYFNDILHELITGTMECALEKIDLIHGSKFKEGISNINAGLFSGLTDLVFIIYNWDPNTGILDCSNQSEGIILVKKISLFASVLEGFRRDSEKKKLFESYKKQIKDLENSKKTELLESEDKIRELKKRVRDLEDVQEMQNNFEKD